MTTSPKRDFLNIRIWLCMRKPASPLTALSRDLFNFETHYEKIQQPNSRLLSRMLLMVNSFSDKGQCSPYHLPNKETGTESVLANMDYSRYVDILANARLIHHRVYADIQAVVVS